MKKKLKILTLILMIVFIICSARMDFAATPITSISTNSGNNTSSNNVANNSANNISNNNVNENNTANLSNNTNNDTYNNVSNNNTRINTSDNNTITNTTIPEAGAKSKTILISLIFITVFSAFYTYAKIKKYNI